MMQLISEIDESSNFITQKEVGMLEARYVRRTDDKLSVYVSSQTGCNHACSMCHLTETRQTKFRDTTPDEFILQFNQVTTAIKNKDKIKRIHVNFMARGEPLSNKNMQSDSYSILSPINDAIICLGASPRFCISTIMPKSIMNMDLRDMFKFISPEFYYSIYTVDDEVRAKLLPNAMPVRDALEKLTDWQQFTNKIPRIHFPFIAGVNDSKRSIIALIEAINSYGLKVNVNIPAYNPVKGTEESSNDIIRENIELLRSGLNCRVKYIERVGYDVKASCGMFLTP